MGYRNILSIVINGDAGWVPNSEGSRRAQRKGHGRVAAAFALKRSGKPEAQGILYEKEPSHADPNVRRLCKLAIGESLHEH